MEKLQIISHFIKKHLKSYMCYGIINLDFLYIIAENGLSFS